MCDGEEGVPDSLNLMRIPQISTPERESFKAYRERQRERKHNDAAPPPTEAELMRAEMERVPLGAASVDVYAAACQTGGAGLLAHGAPHPVLPRA